MKRKEKKIVIILVLTILTFGLGITYSVFHSDAGLISEDQKIAQFVFNSESVNHINLSIFDINPGDSEEYLFSVSNNKSTDISKVTIEYQFTIKTFHFIPFIIELYKINESSEELVYKCDESYTRNKDNELVCNSPIQKMEYSSKKKDDYKLKVEFPAEYNDVSYSDLVDYINIEIKSWQKTDS